MSQHSHGKAACKFNFGAVMASLPTVSLPSSDCGGAAPQHQGLDDCASCLLAKEVWSSPALARRAFSTQELILNISSPASQPRVFCRFSSLGQRSVFLNLLWQEKYAGCPKAGKEAFCCPDQLLHAELNFMWVDVLDAYYLHLYSISSVPKPDGNCPLMDINSYIFVCKSIIVLLTIAMGGKGRTMIKLCETDNTSTPFLNIPCMLVHSLFFIARPAYIFIIWIQIKWSTLTLKN